MGESTTIMAGHRVSKSLVLLAMLIGLACVTLWAFGKNGQQTIIDPAASLAMMTQPTRNFIPGRRAVLTGIASMTPLIAITDQAKAANKAVSPELDAELRKLAGKPVEDRPNEMKVKNLLADEPPPPPPKEKIVSPAFRKKETAPAPAEPAAAPSAPSLPSFSAPSLPSIGGFKLKLPAPF